MLKLPNNLRNIRKNHQNPELRSGEKVAELIGVSKQYYYDLETGRNNCRLNIDHINKLTKILNVTADEILNSTSDNSSLNILKKPITAEDEVMPIFDDPKVRALARISFSKDPSKEALLKKLINSMLEED